MKKLCSLLFVCACLAWSQGVDGRWSAEVQARGKKTATKGPQTVTMNLKTDGAKLTGTVNMGGKRGRAISIQDGKIDNGRFTFTTVQTTKKGENKLTWTGSLQGDQLSGTYTNEGGAGKKGRRGTSFNAKRQG
jgi:hypothetical protein